MLKNNAFNRREYRTVLFNILLFYAITIIGEFVDSIIAGRLYGEIGVTAVELVTPVYSTFAGVALLFAVGFQIMHAREMGRFNRKKASQLFGQAIAVAACAGVILMLLTLTLKEGYLTVSGCEGELREAAVRYYRFYPFLGLIYPMFYVLNSLVENDSDGLILILSSIVTVVMNIVLSVILSSVIGLSGLSLGTVISVLCQILIQSLHLKRKSCSICRFRFSINWREQLELFSYGIYGCIGYVCVAVIDVLMHSFILSKFGEGYLTAYAMINLFLDFAIIFEAFSDAGKAIAGVYMGERNHTGVRISLRTILRALVIMGAAYMLVFLGGNSILPKLYGIETPYVFDAAKKTCIIMGASAVFVGVVYLPINMSSCIGHPKDGIFFSLCFNGIFPLGLGILLGSLFGYYGLVWGIALSAIVTIFFCYGVLLIRRGKKDFPYYLGKEEYKSAVYCADSKKRDFSQILDSMENDLLNEGISKEQALHIRLLCEEIMTRVFEMNASEHVLLEFSVLADDEKILIIERDDGALFDINENDAVVSSISAYALPLLIKQERTMEHLITTSNNRNGITIKRV